MSLPILSRITNLGRGLLDRVMHRGDDAHPIDPQATIDTRPVATSSLEAERLAYGGSEIVYEISPASEAARQGGDADDGENWVDALETTAAEDGPKRDHELPIEDDDTEDVEELVEEQPDRPIADLGSAGPRGV